MSQRWQLDRHVRVRGLGDTALAYHAGSGDTHLLPSFSHVLLAVLSEQEAKAPMSPNELVGDSHIAGLQVSEGDVETALVALEEAGLVHAVAEE